MPELVAILAPSGPRYVSPDAEFAVWTATVDDAPVTITGPLGHVNAGDELLCTGTFSEHPKYGLQFAVETFRSTLPRTAEGIRQWLIARVPGIGPAFARAIVDHFGAEDVFTELDRRPERLREVRTRSGRPISAKAVERAVAAWREVATLREVETFLFTHGISAGLAARLVRRYGDDVIGVLTYDPYRLVELPGVGFKIADGIARSLGLELDAAQRLRAGLHFVLQEAEADGNTFLPISELWRRAARVLEIGDVEPLESALRSLVVEGDVVVDGDDRVYREVLWEMERRLADDLAARARDEPSELFAQPLRPQVDVSDEQWGVVELVRTRSLVLLTGLPGAGKTHTQRVLVDVAHRASRRVLLCAPTGKAARRMRDLTGHDAMTIHRALGYSPDEGFQRNERRPLSKDYDLIVVDEASMLSLELADAFFRAAGTCHVLLVGDTDQLPPIGAGRVLADLVDSGVVPRVHLTAIYRQAARSLIIQSARRINGGEPPFLSLDDARAVLGEVDLDEDFFFIGRQEPESIVQAVVELVCERIPARYRLDARRDVMTLVPMRRGVAGLIALNTELEQRLNPGLQPVVVARTGIRVGSRIVQTKNDYTPDREVMNGEVAFVLDWDEEEGEAVLSLDEGERQIVVPADALETYDLAWALTVHRAQGSQFPAVVAPWSSAYAVMLSRALLYTAVTRAQRLCVLVGERRAVAIAVGRAEQRRRHSALAERLRDLPGVPVGIGERSRADAPGAVDRPVQ